ncbi:MAG: hypothetical protein H0V44_03290, partial [Planctomycetes bacterium]|nr:hypothetical protein [Planctomycetota bacterium]
MIRVTALRSIRLVWSIGMLLFLRHSAAAESPVEPVQNSERTGIAAAGGIRFATLTTEGIGIPHVEGRLADGSFIILG